MEEAIGDLQREKSSRQQQYSRPRSSLGIFATCTMTALAFAAALVYIPPNSSLTTETKSKSGQKLGGLETVADAPPASIVRESHDQLASQSHPDFRYMPGMWPFPLLEMKRKTDIRANKKSKQKKTPNIREAPRAPLPLDSNEFALMLERSTTPLAFGPTYRSMCLDLPVIIVL